MSQFAFLRREWPQVFDAAAKAEMATLGDPRAACFYARRALELVVKWAYKHDGMLRLPYNDDLSALIHEPSFKQVTSESVFNKTQVINSLGNRAIHHRRVVPVSDSLAAVRELFHVTYWFAWSYSRLERPAPDITFDSTILSQQPQEQQSTPESLRTIDSGYQQSDEKLGVRLADEGMLDEQLKRARAEIEAAKRAAAALPDTHDYSEVETRDFFIDLLLMEAGWLLNNDRDREYEVTGMPNPEETGIVDYVLWGDDGIPLGIVEAKRARRDARGGQQQAKLYADCLERQFGRRPVIFFSNGFEHWIWDDAQYPPRRVNGFFSKAKLELLIQRRDTQRELAVASIRTEIVGRHYQTRAIRRVAEAFERDRDRKALLVMATGAGKTRTAIALADLLMRCNWVKRTLYLTDRVALVKQATNAFNRFLPEASPINLISDRMAEGRVYVSTYPTMMRLIDESKDGKRRFGVGHFDLIIIDEAHRSVFHKYRAIFEYFDALLVGLTATPKDEVDRNTYRLFDLENGVPTDAYSLEEAVRDGFLVPPKSVSVPLKFQREGIAYDQLPEEEKDQWDALEWSEDGTVPDRVEAEALNRWLFNSDTVDKVLAHLMDRGLKVASGDRLGKTILFAKNQDHAEFIAERFDANYPQYKGQFARVITSKTAYAQSLIEDFTKVDNSPHIAISVDMLDTGIDVPEVVNLAFFKLIRSKTKFWQMLGRGTRLCIDLFSPGRHKELFFLFDYCQNLEYFSQEVPATDGASANSLSQRLLAARLKLIRELDRVRTLNSNLVNGPTATSPDATTDAEVRANTAELMRSQFASIDVEAFSARPFRRIVEKFAQPEAWNTLSPQDFAELSGEVGVLFSAMEYQSEEAKRFDLLILQLQLALLRSESRFASLRMRVVQIIGLLEDKSTIPVVQSHMGIITESQTEEWWVNITVPMLERLRRNLRDLIRLIDKRQRKPVYADFEDLIGGEAEFTLGGIGEYSDFERFRAKARAFLRHHLDHVTIHKLRSNSPLTADDLAELERMLGASGLDARTGDLRRAADESNGLGLFVRSLVGLNRNAAKEAFGTFLEGKSLTANQIEFIDLIVIHLTEHGAMEPQRMYESPFTDLSPKGPDGIFGPEELSELIGVLDAVRAHAIAA